MSQRARQRSAGSGPRYYRLPPFWGLVFMFVLVVLIILFLRRLG